MAPSQSASASGNFQMYTRPPPVGSVPKLRDSCNACASSKIKCHKQKPTCSGCTRRGLKCEYLTSNRGGRAVRNSQNAGHTRQQSQPPTAAAAEDESATITVARASTPITTGTAAPASTGLFNEPTLDPVLTAVSTPATSASDPGSATVPPSTISTLSSLSSLNVGLPFTPGGLGSSSTVFTGLPTPTTHHDLDLSSLLNDCMNEDPIDFLSDPFFIPPSFDNASFLGDITPLPTPVMSIDPVGIENRAPFPQLENELPQQQERDTSDCYCLSTALALMKRLSLKPPAAPCQIFGHPTDPKAASAVPTTWPPTIEEVIIKNQGAIDDIGRMLNCSCARDGYLLALVSLVLLKILAWYEASARASPDARQPAPSTSSGDHGGGLGSTSGGSRVEQVRWAPSVVSSYCLDGEDSARMAAQLVLSELSRVQRLLGGLEDTMQGLSQTFHNDIHGGSQGGLDRDEQGTRFPLLMVEGMVANIKKKLRAISIGLVRRLNSD